MLLTFRRPVLLLALGGIEKMKDNEQCTAWVDKAKLLEWLEFRLGYCLLGDGGSAVDAYRDMIAYVRRMSTRITNLPDIGFR